jgi:hypothetical protein
MRSSAGKREFGLVIIDGVAVFYPANRPGKVTACNLMGSPAPERRYTA